MGMGVILCVMMRYTRACIDIPSIVIATSTCIITFVNCHNAFTVSL
jgi:hypothetical protein